MERMVMVVSLKVAKKNKKLILIDGDKAMGKNNRDRE